MFEYYGHIHVYSPRAGADNLLGSNFFHKHKFSVHLHTPSKFPPFNSILLFFPYFVELHCLLLHAKFQNHRPSGSGEEDFQRFCYL